jgi:hypothetical protein
MQECLFNSYSNNCCAYCKHHHCSMTVKQMKAKGCLQKQCWHLVKNEQHQYWKHREYVKQKRIDRKQAINNYVISVSGGIV